MQNFSDRSTVISFVAVGGRLIIPAVAWDIHTEDKSGKIMCSVSKEELCECVLWGMR